MELCSTLYGSLDGGEFGREWIHVYVWLSPFAVHLKLIRALLIGYTAKQNEKVFVKRKLKVRQTKSKTNQIIWAHVTQDGESTYTYVSETLLEQQEPVRNLFLKVDKESLKSITYSHLAHLLC